MTGSEPDIERCDVAVVGAGSAGAATAALCAARGMRVIVCEARPLHQAGACWVNAVPGWAFDRAGIDQPTTDAELLGRGGAVHLLAGALSSSAHRIIIRDHDLLEVDMRALVARLQRTARAAGATLLEGVRTEGWDGSTLQTTDGDLHPRWVVDASGLAGARLINQPSPGPSDLCSATQQVHEVVDPRGAAAFFASFGAAVGEAISVVGLAGGFSTLGLRCDAGASAVGILTASIPAEGHPSGQALLERFVDEQPWIGPFRFGGSRAIPLGPPLDRLAEGRVALVGDAGQQVFSPHGSGIGCGLVAAHMIAEALASGAGVKGYAVAFQRRYGGALAAFDLFRRFSQRLEPAELQQLISSNVLSEPIARFGLTQAARWPTAGAIARSTAGAALKPRLGVRLADVVARMGLLVVLYRCYPRDPARLAGWSRHVQRVTRA